MFWWLRGCLGWEWWHKSLEFLLRSCWQCKQVRHFPVVCSLHRPCWRPCCWVEQWRWPWVVLSCSALLLLAWAVAAEMAREGFMNRCCSRFGQKCAILTDYTRAYQCIPAYLLITMFQDVSSRFVGAMLSFSHLGKVVHLSASQRATSRASGFGLFPRTNCSLPHLEERSSCWNITCCAWNLQVVSMVSSFGGLWHPFFNLFWHCK